MSRRLKRLVKKYFKALILLALIVLVFLVWGGGHIFSSHRTFSYNVLPGASVGSVANDLHNAGVFDSVSSFKMAVWVNGNRVQAGEYDIPHRASPWRIAKMLATGDIATTTVLIPEGMTIIQTKKLLQQMPELSGNIECEKTNTAPVCNLHDGDIFPDTYRVARGTSRLAVLDLARKKMIGIQEKVSVKHLPSPLKNWNDVLTLASIVQKETSKVKEMPIVASVYINRLNKNMRLQADPTVVYAITKGLGDMRGAALLSGHLKIDSPYNTYTHNGLPPTPIANVGLDAIRAVLHPADTNYLFFVADGKGGHKFANTYQEHIANHATWRAIKKSRK